MKCLWAGALCINSFIFEKINREAPSPTELTCFPSRLSASKIKSIVAFRSATSLAQLRTSQGFPLSPFLST